MDDPTLELLQQTLESRNAHHCRDGDRGRFVGQVRLTMQMPLEPNRNHQYSAFAGSLNALCTIVGWGTIFMLLHRESLDGNIVIRRGKIRYLRPVRTPEFLAVGLPIDPTQGAYFFELLRSKGKSKIDVAVEIADRARPVCQLYRFVRRAGLK